MRSLILLVHIINLSLCRCLESFTQSFIFPVCVRVNVFPLTSYEIVRSRFANKSSAINKKFLL